MRRRQFASGSPSRGRAPSKSLTYCGRGILPTTVVGNGGKGDNMVTISWKDPLLYKINPALFVAIHAATKPQKELGHAQPTQSRSSQRQPYVEETRGDSEVAWHLSVPTGRRP